MRSGPLALGLLEITDGVIRRKQARAFGLPSGAKQKQAFVTSPGGGSCTRKLAPLRVTARARDFHVMIVSTARATPGRHDVPGNARLPRYHKFTVSAGPSLPR